MVKRRRRVSLLSWGLTTSVLWLMGMEREVRLLRVVAVRVVEVRVAFNRRMIWAPATIIVRMWGSPYLALLSSSGRPFILVGEPMWLASPFTRPLMLVRRHPCALIGEVAVVALSADVVMRVMAASLVANRGWGLIGCPRCRAGLLNGSQSTLSHAVWRSVAPMIKKDRIQNSNLFTQ